MPVGDRWRRGDRVDRAGVPRPRPNRKPPVLSRLSRLVPISRTSVRLTSAILTWSMTCCGVAVRSRLTTWRAVADERLGEPLGLGRVGGLGDGAGQQDHAVHRRRGDVRLGHRDLQHLRRPRRGSGRRGRWPNRPPGRRGRSRRPWCCRRPCRRCRSGWASWTWTSAMLSLATNTSATAPLGRTMRPVPTERVMSLAGATAPAGWATAWAGAEAARPAASAAASAVPMRGALDPVALGHLTWLPPERS